MAVRAVAVRAVALLIVVVALRVLALVVVAVTAGLAVLARLSGRGVVAVPERQAVRRLALFAGLSRRRVLAVPEGQAVRRLALVRRSFLVGVLQKPKRAARVRSRSRGLSDLCGRLRLGRRGRCLGRARLDDGLRRGSSPSWPGRGPVRRGGDRARRGLTAGLARATGGGGRLCRRGGTRARAPVVMRARAL